MTALPPDTATAPNTSSTGQEARGGPSSKPGKARLPAGSRTATDRSGIAAGLVRCAPVATAEPITDEERQLLAAFRALGDEQHRTIFRFITSVAAENRKKKPALRLVPRTTTK